MLLRRYPDTGLEGLLPGAVLTLITLVLLLSSFGVALGSLFLASDLDLLMAAPVDRRAVFVSKILDGMGWYYVLVAALALPALFLYGGALRYGPLYYVLTLLTVLGAPLLPAALGALLVLLVARFAPARRVREVLGLVAALVGVSCSVVGQTSRVWGGRLREAGVDPRTVLGELREALALPLPPLIAGRGLAAAGAGDWGAALRDVAGFFLLTFGVFAGCVRAGRPPLRHRLGAHAEQRERPPQPGPGGARGGPRRLAGAGPGRPGHRPQGLAHDPPRPAQLRPAPLPLDHPPRGVPQPPLQRRPAGRRSPAAPGGPGRSDGGHRSAGGLRRPGRADRHRPRLRAHRRHQHPREGKAWWLLKAAPLSGTELLGGKLLAAAVPFALLSSLLMLGAALWLGFGPLGALYGWLGVELIGVGMLALSVGLGVPWARLDWDDPRRMSSGWGGLISAGASFLYALLSGACSASPCWSRRRRPATPPAPGPWAWAAPWPSPSAPWPWPCSSAAPAWGPSASRDKRPRRIARIVPRVSPLPHLNLLLTNTPPIRRSLTGVPGWRPPGGLSTR